MGLSGQTCHTCHMISNIQPGTEKTLINRWVDVCLLGRQLKQVHPCVCSSMETSTEINSRFCVLFCFLFSFSTKTFDQNRTHFLDRYNLATPLTFSWHPGWLTWHNDHGRKTLTFHTLLHPHNYSLGAAHWDDWTSHSVVPTWSLSIVFTKDGELALTTVSLWEHCHSEWWR